MKKLLLLSLICLGGCTSPVERQQTLKELYPLNVITPATSLLYSQGYQFLMEDTIAGQIYAVSFWDFSNKKISSIRNIK